MRLELISQIGGTETRLMFSGLVTRENSGKIREINGKRLGIPKCFPTLNETGNKAVPNAGTKSEPGRGCSRMLRTGNFPKISGKFPVPGKCHSGMQTSSKFQREEKTPTCKLCQRFFYLSVCLSVLNSYPDLHLSQGNEICRTNFTSP